MAAEMSGGVLVFGVPGADSGAAFQALYEEHNVAATGRSDGIRLSPHVYNTLADVEYVLEAIEAVMG